MKILYDHQIFTSQKYGGISRYFYELIHYFNKKKGNEIFISIVFSNNYYISDKKDVKHISFLPQYDFKGKHRLVAPINKMWSILKIKKQNFDVFHPTYYNPYFLDYIGNKPFVLTVYDMIHEKFPAIVPAHDKTSERKRILADKASKIIAISESTKNDLIEIFDVNPLKIEVIHLATEMKLNKKLVLEVSLQKEYILFVGTRHSYKNFKKFITSIENLLCEKKELSVICIGGGEFSGEEISFFDKLNIRNQIFQYTVNDELLANYYSHAIMFVFPSLYEGFGIPVLEAFACECPLICSNTSSLPEIAGDAAEYFDPYSEESMRNAITKVLISPARQDILREKGKQRLKYFSWEETAQKTHEVYKSIIL